MSKTQLHGKFTIQAINTWTVPLVRYEAGKISRTAQELRSLDTKTRKLMTDCTSADNLEAVGCRALKKLKAVRRMP